MRASRDIINGQHFNKINIQLTIINKHPYFSHNITPAEFWNIYKRECVPHCAWGLGLRFDSFRFRSFDLRGAFRAVVPPSRAVSQLTISFPSPCTRNEVVVMFCHLGLILHRNASFFFFRPCLALILVDVYD
jgi:hypothetical protein